MSKIFVNFILVIFSLNAFAVDYNLDDIFRETYEPGDHTFIVTDIARDEDTRWYLNGVYQQTSETSYWTWFNAEFDHFLSAGDTFTIRAEVYSNYPDGDHLRTYTWFGTVKPNKPSVINSSNITSNSATIEGYGVYGSTHYSVQYKKIQKVIGAL